MKQQVAEQTKAIADIEEDARKARVSPRLVALTPPATVLLVEDKDSLCTM